MNNRRYKTLLCRHFEKNGVCQLGERCGFAHGQQDLRRDDDPIPQSAQFSVINQMGVNPQQMMKVLGNYNYKTSRCINFDTGLCKNGVNCNFAHGDQDLRQHPQNQNIGLNQQQQYMMMYQMQQQQMGMYNPPVQATINPNSQLDQIRQQAMLNIIQQLIAILQHDANSINKLNQAAQYIWVQMLEQANLLVQEVMNDPIRTDLEIEQYTNIFNTTQQTLNQQQNLIMKNQTQIPENNNNKQQQLYQQTQL